MWQLQSGEEVVDRYNSHLHNGISALLPEVLVQVESKGRKFFIEEVNLGRIVGESICVATKPDDQIVFAKRLNRFGHTRFVMNRVPEPCSTVVIILKAADGQLNYVLVTAFIGTRPEPEPWDRRAFSLQSNSAEAEHQSRAFWGSHALVWGHEEIIPGTEIADCPW